MAIDLNAMSDIVRQCYLNPVKEMLEKRSPLLNRFDMFTFRGKPVKCPVCEPSNPMAFIPEKDLLSCMSCGVSFGLKELMNLNVKDLTVEVLDSLLQAKAQMHVDK